MKHSSTRSLYAYWNERRGTRAAPERGEIEPGGIRGALGDSFILSTDPAVGHAFRLAGTRVCGLFEMKGDGFVPLWDESDRTAIADLLAIVANEIAAIVAGTTAEGHSVDLELLLLPLRHRGSSRERQIGVLVPLATPFWLGASPVVRLTLKSHRRVGPTLATDATTPFMAAVENGRRRRGLLVYDGGRT